MPVAVFYVVRTVKAFCLSVCRAGMPMEGIRALAEYTQISEHFFHFQATCVTGSVEIVDMSCQSESIFPGDFLLPFFYALIIDFHYFAAA